MKPQGDVWRGYDWWKQDKDLPNDDPPLTEDERRQEWQNELERRQVDQIFR